jgi:hypothetical protein
MTHPLYSPSTARSPKTISFEPLERGADAAEAAIRAAEDKLVAAMKAQEARDALYAKRDQLTEEQLPGSSSAAWGAGRWPDREQKPAADRGPDPPVGRGRGQARRRPGVASLPAGLHDRGAEAAASKMEDSAHRAIEEQDRQAREVGEEISQLVISSRSVRDQIAAGSIAPGEALERLADLREHHRRLAARTQSIKTVYERQLKIVKDPGAAVDDLRSRFPALNR